MERKAQTEPDRNGGGGKRNSNRKGGDRKRAIRRPEPIGTGKAIGTAIGRVGGQVGSETIGSFWEDFDASTERCRRLLDSFDAESRYLRGKLHELLGELYDTHRNADV